MGPAYPRPERAQTAGFSARRTGNQEESKRTKGDSVYIGGGVLALIVVILLLIWIF